MAQVTAMVQIQSLACELCMLYVRPKEKKEKEKEKNTIEHLEYVGFSLRG